MEDIKKGKVDHWSGGIYSLDSQELVYRAYLLTHVLVYNSKGPASKAFVQCAMRAQGSGKACDTAALWDKSDKEAVAALEELEQIAPLLSWWLPTGPGLPDTTQVAKMLQPPAVEAGGQHVIGRAATHKKRATVLVDDPLVQRQLARDMLSEISLVLRFFRGLADPLAKALATRVRIASFPTFGEYEHTSTLLWAQAAQEEYFQGGAEGGANTMPSSSEQAGGESGVAAKSGAAAGKAAVVLSTKEAGEQAAEGQQELEGKHVGGKDAKKKTAEEKTIPEKPAIAATVSAEKKRNRPEHKGRPEHKDLEHETKTLAEKEKETDERAAEELEKKVTESEDVEKKLSDEEVERDQVEKAAEKSKIGWKGTGGKKGTEKKIEDMPYPQSLLTVVFRNCCAKVIFGIIFVAGLVGLCVFLGKQTNLDDQLNYEDQVAPLTGREAYAQNAANKAMESVREKGAESVRESPRKSARDKVEG